MKTKNRFCMPAILFALSLVFLTYCKKVATIPLVSTYEIKEVTQTTATCGGIIIFNGGAIVSENGVCWSTSQNPTIADNKTIDATGVGSFTNIITGLAANTRYYVRAYATNSAGTAYGNAKSFTTQQEESAGSFTDSRDGNVYNWVKIGNQVWMSENLRYLPSVVVPETASDTTPYYYVYGYNGTNVSEAKATANYTSYGVLYNWTAACSSCPAGWHLPTNEEWSDLIYYLEGYEVAGGKLKETGTTHWESPNEGATNVSGFTALPGGNRNSNGTFLEIGTYGHWWSIKEYSSSSSGSVLISYSYINIYKDLNYKEDGYSVRCVKD